MQKRLINLFILSISRGKENGEENIGGIEKRRIWFNWHVIYLNDFRIENRRINVLPPLLFFSLSYLTAFRIYYLSYYENKVNLMSIFSLYPQLKTNFNFFYSSNIKTSRNNNDVREEFKWNSSPCIETIFKISYFLKYFNIRNVISKKKWRAKNCYQYFYTKIDTSF